MPDAIVAIGGTGKRTALLYMKLVNTLRPANIPAPGRNVFVVDMEPEPGTPDAQLDDDLRHEGVPESNFFSPVGEDARVNRTITLAKFVGFAEGGGDSLPLAHVLFNSGQLNVQIIKGMNCEPTVGATVAARRFSSRNQEPEVQNLEICLAAFERIVTVGSVIGGTGAGVTSQLVSWINHRIADTPVYGLLYLRWLNIPDGGVDEPNNLKMSGNMKAWLNYLLEHHPDNRYGARRELFKHYVLVGAPPTMTLSEANSAGHHPLHLLGAVYLFQFDHFVQVAPGASGPHYLELGQGITPNVIQMGDDTMGRAVIREKLFAMLCREFKEQRPDEALSSFTLFLPGQLAFKPFIRTLEKVAAKWNRAKEVREDWIKVTSIFDQEARSSEERVEELKKLTATMDGARDIFDFDWNFLLQQAETKLSDARELVARNLIEAPVAFPSLEQAVNGIALNYVGQLRDILRANL
jgi:hypothetical protein